MTLVERSSIAYRERTKGENGSERKNPHQTKGLKGGKSTHRREGAKARTETRPSKKNQKGNSASKRGQNGDSTSRKNVKAQRTKEDYKARPAGKNQNSGVNSTDRKDWKQE